MKEELGDRINVNNHFGEKSNANDPFVLKKVAESKSFLEKNGFPEELVEWRKKKELTIQKPFD